MQHNLRPTDERDLGGVIVEAARSGRPLEIAGGGSKARMGRPTQAAAGVSVRNMRGITLYEPAEMVISARAGTPLQAIEAELGKHHQILASEPIDLGPMLGDAPGQSTLGGVVATNLSGSRRIIAGAVRDHVLGLRAINGRGEAFKWGGRIMKNVTGYDLCRGLAGSWGTLAVLTEVTLKAVPAAEEVRTLLLLGQPDELAIEALCAAVGTPYEVSAALHVDAELAKRMRTPAAASARAAVTALRIENFSSSVAYRIGRLRELFAAYGDLVELDHAQSAAFWAETRALSFLQGSADPVWRISTAPKMGPRVVQAVKTYMPCRAAYDWSGGLVWLEVPRSADAGSADIRRVIATRGGHATLVRADPAVRASVEVFQPLEAPVRELSRRLKEAFDPARVLNPGRMYAEI